MGKSSCSFCAAAIPPSDFDQGLAVVVLKRTYCRKCMERAVRQKTKHPRSPARPTPDKFE